MPLEYLYLFAVPVTSLEPLRGLPLKRIHLLESPPGIDVSPLMEITTLEQVLLPPDSRNADALKSLPNLVRISPVWDNDRREIAQTAAEFFGGKPAVSVESLAREGRFADAEALLRTAKSPSLSLGDLPRYREALGVLVFAQGDRHRYEALCKEMVETCRMTTARSAEVTARICLLGAQPGISRADLESIVEESRRIKTNGLEEERAKLLMTAMFEYRAGRSEKAEEILNDLPMDTYVPRVAATTAVLAMAYYQQGEREAAEKHLTRAEELCRQGWPTTKGPPIEWCNYLFAHLLVQEAKKLIAPAKSENRKGGI
jgi:hypothetical protein